MCMQHFNVGAGQRAVKYSNYTHCGVLKYSIVLLSVLYVKHLYEL